MCRVLLLWKITCPRVGVVSYLRHVSVPMLLSSAHAIAQGGLAHVGEANPWKVWSQSWDVSDKYLNNKFQYALDGTKTVATTKTFTEKKKDKASELSSKWPGLWCFAVQTKFHKATIHTTCMRVPYQSLRWATAQPYDSQLTNLQGHTESLTWFNYFGQLKRSSKTIPVASNSRWLK